MQLSREFQFSRACMRCVRVGLRFTRIPLITLFINELCFRDDDDSILSLQPSCTRECYFGRNIFCQEKNMSVTRNIAVCDVIVQMRYLVIYL